MWSSLLDSECLLYFNREEGISQSWEFLLWEKRFKAILRKLFYDSEICLVRKNIRIKHLRSLPAGWIHQDKNYWWKTLPVSLATSSRGLEKEMLVASVAVLLVAYCWTLMVLTSLPSMLLIEALKPNCKVSLEEKRKLLFILERCKTLVQLARKYDVMLLAEDVYNLLHYSGNQHPPARLLTYDSRYA